MHFAFWFFGQNLRKLEMAMVLRAAHRSSQASHLGEKCSVCANYHRTFNFKLQSILHLIFDFLDRIWQNWKWLWSSEQLIDPVKQATWEKSVLSVPITVEHSTFPCYLWAWCTKFHTISIIMGWLFSGGVFIHISLIYMLKCHKNVLVIISCQTHL